MGIVEGSCRVKDIAEGWEMIGKGPILFTATFQAVRFARKLYLQHSRAGEVASDRGWWTESWRLVRPSFGRVGTCASCRS